MQPTRAANARAGDVPHPPPAAPGVYPSRPPAHVEQGKRHHRLQRQKEVNNFFRQSTSESLPDDEVTGPGDRRSPSNGGDLHYKRSIRGRPLLQRQQRQSSEEAESSVYQNGHHLRAAAGPNNVHFKEAPEYFEVASVVAQQARSEIQQRKTWQQVQQQQRLHHPGYSEVYTNGSARHFLCESYGPSSTYAMVERSSLTHHNAKKQQGKAAKVHSFETAASATVSGYPGSLIASSPVTTSTTIHPVPAEALLGSSPTSAGEPLNWGGKTLPKKQFAVRRALPTTIESFDENGQAEFGIEKQIGGYCSLLQEGAQDRILAVKEEEAGEASCFQSASLKRKQQQKQQRQQLQAEFRGCQDGWPPPEPSSLRLSEDSSSNILHSPAASVASGSTSGGRLLPHVPKRFVVPRVSAKEFRDQQRYHRVSFEDENNAVTHLGGLNSDSNGNESCHSPAADLIDEIGPAPDHIQRKPPHKMVTDNVTEDFYGDVLSGSDSMMIPDTYSSLQRAGPRQSRREAFQRQTTHNDFVYGTYRPHNSLHQRRPMPKYGYESEQQQQQDFELYSRPSHLRTKADLYPQSASISSTSTINQPRVQSQDLPSSYHHFGSPLGHVTSSTDDFASMAASSYSRAANYATSHDIGATDSLQRRNDFSDQGYNGYSNHDGLSLDYDSQPLLQQPQQPQREANGDPFDMFDQTTGCSSYGHETVNPLTEEDLATDLYANTTAGNATTQRKTVGWDEDNLIQEETYHQEPSPYLMEEQQHQNNGYASMGNGHAKEYNGFVVNEYQHEYYSNQAYPQQYSNNYANDSAGMDQQQQPFLNSNNMMATGQDGQPVQLTPSWEEQRHVTQDHLNFRTLSVSMDRLDLEMNPPLDRFNLIYLTLILHGIGTLMPWNMFITAKELKRGDWVYMVTEYFVNYKLGKEYTDSPLPYATYFLQYVGFAAQIPNLAFNWINIFVNVGGNLTGRIVWTLLIEVLVFVVTIILAMVDSSDWPGLFFYLTLGCVVTLNMATGMYQNTVYGLAAKLPFKYTGAVVLGSNLSGTIVSIISIISLALSPNPRTAAIYYFITALFILLACFDTYFALPLNRFYRYHDHMYNKALFEKKRRTIVHAMPYGLIFKQCFPQCFNVFFTYFVTLTIFPAVLADVKMAHDDFAVSAKYYTPITCFLTFNLCAVIGNLIPSLFRFPSPKWLFIPVMLRFLFLPYFLLCNYRPSGVERLWPAMIHWDYAFWAGSALFGLTGGYFSSLAMMYCPRSVEPVYASIAGMFGAASIVSGIFAGIGFSYLMPLVVSHPALTFDAPDWWPSYVN